MEEIILYCGTALGILPKQHVSERLLHLRMMKQHCQDEQEKSCEQKWFLDHIEEFCRDDEALEFINHQGWLCRFYLLNLKDAEKNVDLQKKLISVYYNEMLRAHRVRYNRLLCDYLLLWDLSLEIKGLMYMDDTRKTVRRIYGLFRQRGILELATV